MEFCLKVATEGIQKQVIRDANKNVVMSASSLNLLLNMAALGSSGKTLKQSLGGCLGSETITNLRSKSSYLMALLLDSIPTQNSTSGLIEDYLPRLVKLEPPLLLANALCFKGAWRDPFIALSPWNRSSSVSCKLISGGMARSRYRPPEFVANHPFMFTIREKVSQAVIFTGAVLNPLSG
ncbi:hypothetical protein FEM48_Zijuj10G0164100 [Ziziphus jujuba var. spinosa]|uniref:Serpin domain-containing protein n=1 Tax=Ziziphus jujuba var. spinosa TaxID=714518 RepID=A0A978UPG0_ZIZJJ|nr:hypothetical protein FEM48_Zijuj10G0164100 [Ziziphus jujuba var. spinosa]